ncbi:MAG: hypothetical protein Q4C47_03295 [Planctomycetia bacterium]|nr:hypothetical protein [Planctomycetia bacterium]
MVAALPTLTTVAKIGKVNLSIATEVAKIGNVVTIFAGSLNGVETPTKKLFRRALSTPLPGTFWYLSGHGVGPAPGGRSSTSD